MEAVLVGNNLVDYYRYVMCYVYSFIHNAVL